MRRGIRAAVDPIAPAMAGVDREIGRLGGLLGHEPGRGPIGKVHGDGPEPTRLVEGDERPRRPDGQDPPAGIALATASPAEDGRSGDGPFARPKRAKFPTF